MPTTLTSASWPLSEDELNGLWARSESAIFRGAAAHVEPLDIVVEQGDLLYITAF